jgi:hypothetical protein
MDVHNMLIVQKWNRDKAEYDHYLRTSNDERLLTFEQYFKLKLKPIPIKYDYNDQNPTSINKYIDEFEFLNHKYVNKMSDFKDNELNLWKTILKEIYSEWDPN